VVDGDPYLVNAIADELSQRGCKVKTFSDPLRALGALVDSRADLLVTDLSMPWVDGQHVIASARARQPDLKILLMSGFARAADIAERTHVRFLQKPIDLDELCEAVDAALNERDKREGASDSAESSRHG
jgi:two-component system C4-dicarboxylate transport response regulator DctD